MSMTHIETTPKTGGVTGVQAGVISSSACSIGGEQGTKDRRLRAESSTSDPAVTIEQVLEHMCTCSMTESFSQSVSHFTVPPRAHPSTGSQSGELSRALRLFHSAFSILRHCGHC